MLEDISGDKIPLTYADWRPGDQVIFVSDIRRAKTDLGWAPKIGVREGVERLWRWVTDNKDLLERLLKS